MLKLLLSLLLIVNAQLAFGQPARSPFHVLMDTVIKSASPGNHQECFAAPAPHFFTDVYGEYTDAIMKWAMSLK